jgi:low affinity Fe/Cu permease
LTAYFEQFSRAISNALGSPLAFVLAVALVLVWVIAGPFFDWNEAHSLLINTLTTIGSFLMIFLLQSSQVRDTVALQLKMDELILVTEGARNTLIKLEDMDTGSLARVKDDLVKSADEGIK